MERTKLGSKRAGGPTFEQPLVAGTWVYNTISKHQSQLGQRVCGCPALDGFQGRGS
jgi:hypothetical protein